MKLSLPAPVSAYFLASNRHDIDSMLVPFSTDAVVQDEGEEHVGHTEIREWMVKTTRKYLVTVEPQETEELVGRTTVVGLVSGNFPGSPARLRFSFALSPAGIYRLEIG
ncbi:MAG: nuclear transport factor 2 family protein [Janthinobacterium lividum]